jgi:hypothetical protein
VSERWQTIESMRSLPKAPRLAAIGMFLTSGLASQLSTLALPKRLSRFVASFPRPS